MTIADKYTYSDGLSSERLRTRFLEPGDYKSWAEFFEDGEATEFIPGVGLNSSEDLARFWMHKQIKRYENREFGLQAVIIKESGVLAGLCGLLSQEIRGQKHVEVGYHFLKKYWGHGYAPEAARIFIDYAFNNNITDTVISIINVNNIRSQRVADKNGLVRTGIEKWHGNDAYIYSIRK